MHQLILTTRQNDITNGLVIDEQVIRGEFRPDPDPIPEDANPNMNLLDMLNTCLSLASMARQWYEAVNTKPDVVSCLSLPDSIRLLSLTFDDALILTMPYLIVDLMVL